MNFPIDIARRLHQPASGPASNHRVDTQQYLRAVAAFSVVLYHASYYTNLYTGDARFLVSFGGGFGTFGVLVFFALSGHLMAVQAVRMAGRPMLFMAHRLVRIYPIFWLICLVRIVVGIRLGTGQFDPLVLMLSPVGQRDYPLEVEWTLVYEVAFYIIVCAVVVARIERWIGLVGAVWLASIIGRTWILGCYTPQFTTSLQAIPMSGVCSAFAAGLVVPTLLARRWISSSALPMAALLIAVAQFPRLIAYSTITTGIACAMLVAWVASLTERNAVSPTLGRLGDWSYATYLTHVPILITLGTLGLKMNRPGIYLAVIALVVIATVLFGTADVTLHRKLRRAVDRWGWSAQALLLATFAGGYLLAMALSIAHDRQQAETFASLTGIEGRPSLEALEQAGWHQDDRLVGHLDSISRAEGLAYLSGWVNDPDDILNRVSLLVLSGDMATLAVPRSYRFDLIRSLGFARSMAPAAFRRAIPDAACPSTQVVLPVVISRRSRSYRALSTERCPA